MLGGASDRCVRSFAPDNVRLSAVPNIISDNHVVPG